MTDAILTHDAGISAFEDAGGAVSSDDGGVSFNWDEKHIVTVDAPADLQGAFDTERFYKIEGATIARPIKQHYLVGDEFEVYKKPAEALERAAWSFDNAPFTLGHPDSGMVKNVDDIHGFWRNPRYDTDDDRLKEDLYVPVTDSEALEFIEENEDVSVGFYNRVTAEYDGETGDLTDDDVDGFQVQMYGDHIAGVEQGRCSAEDGCGLDDSPHGEVVADATTSFENQRGMTESDEMFSAGDRVKWQADAVVAHNPDDESGVMIEILDRNGDSTEMVTTVDEDSIWHAMARRDTYEIAPPTADYTEEGTYYAIAPDETSDDEPKYPINSCSDVDDAWKLRGHGDYDISQSTLEDRIKRKARDLGCDVPDSDSEESTDSDCPCDPNDTDMTDDNDFDIPDLSVDALADKNDSVSELREERDSLEARIDEMEAEIEDALDSAENFTVQVDDDECVCEAVEDLVGDLDEKAEQAERVEELQDELKEYREEEREEALDTLEDLGADRDEYTDEDLEDIEEEIDRREEVLDEADVETSVKGTEDNEPNEDTDDETETTTSGTRSFGRGFSA
jgi:hypothetical protein